MTEEEWSAMREDLVTEVIEAMPLYECIEVLIGCFTLYSNVPYVVDFDEEAIRLSLYVEMTMSTHATRHRNMTEEEELRAAVLSWVAKKRDIYREWMDKKNT